MNFDLDKLMESPMFVAGMSLMGGAAPGMAPLSDALQSLQQMKKLKGDRAHQQQKLSLEQSEHESMKTYRAAQTEQAKAQSALYGRQVATAEANAAREAESDKLLRDLAQRMGLLGEGGTSPQPGMPGPSLPGAAAPSPPMQPPPQMHTIPQLAKPTNAVEAGMAAQVASGMGPDPKALAREIAATTADLAKVNDPNSKEQLNAYLRDLKQQQSALGAPKALGGSNEQQAKGHNDFQALAAQAEKHRKAQQLFGLARALKRDPAGYGMMVEGMKPDYETPKLQLQVEKENRDAANTAADNLRADAEQANRNAEATRQADLHESKKREQAAEEARKQAKADEAALELRGRKAKEAAGHQTNVQTIDRTQTVIKRLLDSKSLPWVTGRAGVLIPEEAATVINEDWGNTIADIKQVVGAMTMDTLQDMRKNAPTGASGLGQFQKFESDIMTALQGLDRRRDAKSIKESLRTVNELLDTYKRTSADVYKGTYGEDAPMPAKPAAPQGLPQGAKKIGTSNGKPVYELPDGSRVIGK